MTIKSILLTATLALASLTMASAKSYDISLSNNVQVGNVQLKAGQYSLKVEGGSAIFTDVQSAKSFTAPVKVDTGSKKFNATMVDTDKNGSTETITSIELGGSKTTLQFGQKTAQTN